MQLGRRPLYKRRCEGGEEKHFSTLLYIRLAEQKRVILQQHAKRELFFRGEISQQ